MNYLYAALIVLVGIPLGAYVLGTLDELTGGGVIISIAVIGVCAIFLMLTYMVAQTL